MRIMLVMGTVYLLTACTAFTGETPVLERVEFGPDEVGCVRITGSIKMSPGPLGGTEGTALLIKRKVSAIDAEGNVITPETVPEC